MRIFVTLDERYVRDLQDRLDLRDDQLRPLLSKETSRAGNERLVELIEQAIRVAKKKDDPTIYRPGGRT